MVTQTLNEDTDKSEEKIKELEYRLAHCIELLEQAKCPAGCTGSCAWCYERSVELKAHK